MQFQVESPNKSLFSRSKKNGSRDERGMALLFVVVCSTLFMLLGLSLIVVSARRYQAERAVTQTLQAAYEGDLEHALSHAGAAARAWPDSTALRLDRLLATINPTTPTE